MQGEKPSSAFDIIEQGVLLVLRDPVDIGIDQQAIVSFEKGGIEIGDVLGVHELDAATQQCWCECPKSECGLMMPAIAEKEKLQDGLRFGAQRRDEQEAKAERAKEKIAHHVESKGWVEKETILSVASLMSTHFSYCLISGRIIMAAKAESQGEIAAMKNRLPVEGGEQQAPILGQEPEQGEAKAFSAYHASGDVILEVLGFSTMLVGHPPRDVPNGDNTQEAVVENHGQVAASLLGKQVHGLLDCRVRGDGVDGRCHHFGYPGVEWIQPGSDDTAEHVAFGEHAHQMTAVDDDNRAHPAFVHFFNGCGDADGRGDGIDEGALSLQ